MDNDYKDKLKSDPQSIFNILRLKVTIDNSKYSVIDNGDVIYLKNRAGNRMSRLRIKKYPTSGKIFMSIGDYKNGECLSEAIISLSPEQKAKLKEWL